MKLIDMTGQRFGRWTVIERGSTSRTWLCRCDCGTIKDVYTTNLRSGLSTSCGCHRNVIHGKSKDSNSLYTTWEGIKQRTGNPRNPSYRNYGGRGIALYSAWADYATFEADILAAIGPRPQGMSLDRIDVDGNYEPGNLRWATRADQMRNRRDARWRVGEKCSFPGCGRRRDGHDLCQSHRRQRARGEELRSIRSYAVS